MPAEAAKIAALSGSLAAFAVLGYAALALAGLDPHGRELAVAAAASLAGGILGLVPLLLARHARVETRAQAALAGTAAQLLATIALGAAIALGRLVASPAALLLWMVGCYWVSLVVLVVLLVRELPRQ